MILGGEDSLPLPTTENTTTTVPATDPPTSPAGSDVEIRETQRDNFTESWDKTLSWENTLPQVNLLKSVGNGSCVFVRTTRSTNNISRTEPVQLTIRL